MKIYFRLTKNGTFSGDFEELALAKDRASTLEGRSIGKWQELDETAVFSLCEGDRISRNEYEIRTLKKRS